MTNKIKQDSSTGPQGTQVFDLAQVNKMIADEITQSQSESAEVPAFVGISQSVNGQKFILNKSKLEVGRKPGSDINLSDNSVSSVHAQIIKEENNWKVLNLLSSNGTFVNGKKVSEQFIYPGDRITFASVEFVFTLLERASPTKKTAKNQTIGVVAIFLVLSLAGLLYFII